MEVNDDSSEPDRLPGMSSGQLTTRGYTFLIIGGVMGLSLAFESKLGSHEAMYRTVVLTGCLLAIATAQALFWLGFRKGRREIDRGYTPRVRIAQRNPDLFLVGYKTLKVISEPGDPR